MFAQDLPVKVRAALVSDWVAANEQQSVLSLSIWCGNALPWLTHVSSANDNRRRRYQR